MKPKNFKAGTMMMFSEVDEDYFRIEVKSEEEERDVLKRLADVMFVEFRPCQAAC